MKKIMTFFKVILFASLISCGPSAQELEEQKQEEEQEKQAASEIARKDSLANVEVDLKNYFGEWKCTSDINIDGYNFPRHADITLNKDGTFIEDVYHIVSGGGYSSTWSDWNKKGTYYLSNSPRGIVINSRFEKEVYSKTIILKYTHPAHIDSVYIDTNGTQIYWPTFKTSNMYDFRVWTLTKQ